jgi:hypothetical protein
MGPVSLRGAAVENARLTGASLEGSDLDGADLRGAQLSSARLEDVSARGTNLSSAHLERANLRRAIFDSTTDLSGAFLHEVLIDQAVLGDVNLTVVDWSNVLPLGDEVVASTSDVSYIAKPHDVRVTEYHAAARAYRALSVALRNQGIPGLPTRFHYRGELMERRALFHKAQYEWSLRHRFEAIRVGASWTLSLLLGTLAGYGDRLGRLALTYVSVVLAFGVLFLLVNDLPLTLSHSIDSFSLSVTAFHGRGLLASGEDITQAAGWIAAMESVIGLFVEALFIAAFTRRVIAG